MLWHSAASSGVASSARAKLQVERSSGSTAYDKPLVCGRWYATALCTVVASLVRLSTCSLRHRDSTQTKGSCGQR